MKPPTREHSWYSLRSVSPRGDKVYLTWCIFCSSIEEHVLPKWRSAGFHFSFPIRCDHCGKSSQRYCVGRADPRVKSAAEKDV